MHHAAGDTISLLKEAKRVARRYVVVLEDVIDTEDDAKNAEKPENETETGTGDGGTPRRDRRWASSISRFNIAAAYRATPTAVEGVLRREGRWQMAQHRAIALHIYHPAFHFIQST